MIEDDPAAAELVRRGLESLGRDAQLRVLRDGAEALALIREAADPGPAPAEVPPDLILLDLNLPVADGFEVLEEIQASPMLRLVPVVIVSSGSDPEDVNRCYALGASSFIRKPDDSESCSELLELLLDYWAGIVLRAPHPG